MTQTTQIIITIIADRACLDPAALSADTVLADLGVDSLGMVEAIFAMEEAFDISIPLATEGEPGFDTSTLGTIIEGVEALIAQKAA